ncbi:MAG: DNA polymerase III subunit delta [bacterium]|nr:DNA polymerase III subunit delta [bacterium]
MVILIHGEDTLRSREWLHELIAKFREKFDPDGYNVTRISDPNDLAALHDAVGAPPFFGSKRMVIAENFFGAAKQEKDLGKITERIPESTILIFWESTEEKILEKQKLFQKLLGQKEVKTYTFQPLSAAAFLSWAKTQAEKQKVSFARGAFEHFCARVGVNTWAAQTELEKLSVLKQPVTQNDVVDLVSGNSEGTIFAFVDAIAARDAKKVSAELSRERLQGTAPAQLIAMVSRQVRLLRSASDYMAMHPGATAAEMAEIFRWHPFVAKKTMAQARGFQKEQLKNFSNIVFETDRAMKTGLLDGDTAVETLAAAMII